MKSEVYTSGVPELPICNSTGNRVFTFMQEELRKFRDRLRIMIILYTFCKKTIESDGIYGEFRSEIRIQALDFLLRYPDFLSSELMDLMDSDSSLDRNRIKTTIQAIYINQEPDIRVEEMEKFFYGAYESIDDPVAFLVSVGLITFNSKKRTDGKNYDKIYRVTTLGADKLQNNLSQIPAVKWYFDRCELIAFYFEEFTGSELKSRQYKYSEYSGISYKNYIQNVNEKVRKEFSKKFDLQLV